MKGAHRLLALSALGAVALTASGQAAAAPKAKALFSGGKVPSKIHRTSAGTAESLPANGGFDGSLRGWAGYGATLSLVAPGAAGTHGARVTMKGVVKDFSIFPTARPVIGTTAGAAYTATASVRSATPGRQLCLRVREYEGENLVGSAQVCAAATADWRRLPTLVYKVRGSGHSLDVYAFAWRPVAGDSFEVDEISLVPEGAAPSTVPPPPPPPVSPPASAGLTATTVDHAHVRLSWTPVAGAASYRVVRGSLVVGTTAAPTFTDALLWPQTRYEYRVEALGTDGALLSTRTGSAATAVLPSAGFPRPFAADSVWNRPIGNAPVHPRSSALASYLASHATNPNFTLRSYAVSVAEAHPGDPTHNVPCIRFANCTLGAFGDFAIPVTAQADPSGDGHLAVIDPASGREWDMWQGRRAGASWTAGAGAAVSMARDGIAPARTESGNAANFPLLGGIVRPEEIAQGRIDHALVFMMPGVSNLGRVCPATHNDGDTSDPNALMEGMRIQLDPAVNVDALAIPAWQKTIARALQTYGAYLRDSSGSLAIIGENPNSRGYDAWASVGLGSAPSAGIGGIPWNRFRVLDAATGC